MNRIRLALIGCGNNMRSHVRRLVEIPEVEIVALVEPFAPSLARMIETYPQLASLPKCDNHRTMLTQVKPDAVEISTPHTMHYEQIVDALTAGAHVLVEKPMVCTTAHAKHVCDIVEQSSKVLLVSYQRHTQPVFVKMRQMVADGDLGEVQFITCLQNQKWYTRHRGESWRAQPELSGGGQLNDSGSHLVDVILWVSDLAPEAVYCAQQNFTLNVDVNSAITIKFTNGAIGTMNIVGNAPGIGGAVWEDMTIYGSTGALYYRQLGQPSYEAMLEYRKHDLEEPPGRITDLPPASDPDRNFINAIRGREPVASPPLCGLRTIQLSEAAWKSAASGQAERVDN